MTSPHPYAASHIHADPQLTNEVEVQELLSEPR